MRVITTTEELRHQVDAARTRGDRTALVPTRGRLHAGHASLIRTAHAQCDLVVVTIVGGALPGAGGLRHDQDVAADAGADLVWRPPPGPLVTGARTSVVPLEAPEQAALATATVQQLLLARADVVYVGEHQYDHARLLHLVVRDLLLPVEVRVVPTLRDPDGLPVGMATEALDAQGREAARFVPLALDAVATSAAAGERSLFRLRARAEARLADAGATLTVEDVATVDPATFDPVDVFDRPVLLVVRTTVDGAPITDARRLEPA